MDPRLKDLSLDDQNIVAICYLDDLTRGNTYHGMRVRYSTLKGYMDSMASWVKGHTGRDIRIKSDPEKPRDQWKQHPQLEHIYKDTKSWQGLTKRQDPLTKSMIVWLSDSAKGKDPDCFTNALVDFLIMGTQTGWRGVEWAQPKDPRKHGFYEYDKPTSPFTNRVYALCIEDLKFKHADGRIVQDPMTVADADVARTGVRWRYQKNLNHGEEIEFEATPSNPKFCFCLAALRAYRRFVRTCNKPNTPIAVYKRNPKSKRCSWMVKRGIENKMRFAAWKVFYPDEKFISGSLAKITLHSIRIMAAMLLFEAKASDIMVMGRLRYKSIAFQMYYRNTPALARLHAQAMESSDNYQSAPAIVTDDEDFEEDEEDS